MDNFHKKQDFLNHHNTPPSQKQDSNTSLQKKDFNICSKKKKYISTKKILIYKNEKQIKYN